MTRASLSAPAADQSPGHGDALVHGSNTIREPEPVQAAVLISAVSARVSGHDRSSSTTAHHERERAGLGKKIRSRLRNKRPRLPSGVRVRGKYNTHITHIYTYIYTYILYIMY